jgi:choline dehydrogenase-like flavoprotein
MVKVVACFGEEVNFPDQPDPVHQIKEFDPRFSMGCSISSQSVLALAMADHPKQLAEVDHNWPHMALYYTQTTGGRGTVRRLPGFHDAFVRFQYDPADMRNLGEALRRLSECLFAAGAIALYPSISGSPVLRSVADVEQLPALLPARRTSLMTLHLFSTCPMGEDRFRCGADSFGKVYDTDGLYVADASLLCGPTVVNPQGSVMAVAHRNVLRFLDTKPHLPPQTSTGNWIGVRPLNGSTIEKCQ